MSDGDLPPPPYTEQEFDQKISQALAFSAQQPEAPAEEGEWEEWSDAAFSAAEVQTKSPNANQSSQGAGSSTQPHEGYGNQAAPLQVPPKVGPLRIHKRGKSGGAAAPSKPRPSWMDEAEHDVSHGMSGSSSSGHRPTQSQPPPHLHPWNAAQTHHGIPPDDEDEDRSIPPPPFATMGPPMDGHSRLEYHPESTPPSPLTSPVPDHHLPLHPDHPLLHPGNSRQHPLRPHSLPQPHIDSYPEQHNNGYSSEYPHSPWPPRQSLPIPPRSTDYRLEQRPTSTLGPRQVQGPPRMDFNPSTSPPHPPDHLRPRTVSMFPPSSVQNASRVDFTPSAAYNKPGGLPFAPYPPSQAFNAGAFYNSAVSAQLSTPTSMVPRESHS
ncbi:hypothetical protein FPV67DRAFT_1471597 [Lyophyllum atratum]|nr:hypothetical protein FPV67DRAFT_1471597 [Lyophyllum atratum]